MTRLSCPSCGVQLSEDSELDACPRHLARSCGAISVVLVPLEPAPRSKPRWQAAKR